MSRTLAFVLRQRFQQDPDVGGVHRPQMTVQLDQVLALLEVFYQVATRTILPLRISAPRWRDPLRTEV